MPTSLLMPTLTGSVLFLSATISTLSNHGIVDFLSEPSNSLTAFNHSVPKGCLLFFCSASMTNELSVTLYLSWLVVVLYLLPTGHSVYLLNEYPLSLWLHLWYSSSLFLFSTPRHTGEMFGVLHGLPLDKGLYISWSITLHSLSISFCCLVVVSTGCSVGCDSALLSCVLTAVLIPRLFWLFAFVTAFLVVTLKVCAHSRTSSASRLVYESVIPYLLLISAIHLKIVSLYCFTLGETSPRLSVLTCWNKLQKVVTTRSFNCSVNTCSVILSVLGFVALITLPKYYAPRLSSVLLELFSETGVSGKPVIFFMCHVPITVL